MLSITNSISIKIKKVYRRSRVFINQITGHEPFISRRLKLDLEFHGTDYGGWCIVENSLSEKSTIVDIGLGEDISFSESLINKYGCYVYGFDPTPKSINYIKKKQFSNFSLFEVGVSAEEGEAIFYLPNDANHVSGSLFSSAHVGKKNITVQLIAIENISNMIEFKTIDLLKMDVEGAEFDILQSKGFEKIISKTNQICIEFHHRWPEFGKQKTIDAIRRLEELNFEVTWVSPSNEEVLFVRKGIFS
jgi:FkbM family methyltransferase